MPSGTLSFVFTLKVAASIKMERPTEITLRPASLSTACL
jgi:hypothetical protein